MRLAWLLFVAACSGSSSTVDGAPPGDTAPTCLKRVSFNPAGLYQIAASGDSVLGALYGGLMEFPLDGSSPISVASVPGVQQPVAVASYDGVAMYAVLTPSATEVRLRDGTVVASLPVYERLIDARMNATDFYVLGSTPAQHMLWRVPRTGGQPASYVVPTIAHFELGATFIAWTDEALAQTMEMPSGQYLESIISDRHYGIQVAIVSDTGFVRRGSYNDGTESIERFHPAGGVLEDSIVNDVTFGMLFADDRYIYVETRDTVSPYATRSITAIEPDTLAQHPNATCTEFRSHLRVAFDATNLYGVDIHAGSLSADILIAPRAP